MRLSTSAFVALSLVSALVAAACSEDDPAPAPVQPSAGASSGGSAGAAIGGQGGAAAGEGGAAGSAGAAGVAATGTQAWRTLAFTGSGFAIHEGNKLAVAVTQADNGALVAGKVLAGQMGDTFAFTWPGLLKPGVAYNVDYYADLNNNKACDAPSADHVWRRVVSGTDAGTLSVVHDAEWTNQCPSFATLEGRKNLTFNGTGFVIHDGSKIEIVVTRSADGVAVAHGGYTALEGDKLSFSWDGLLEVGKAYSVDYYADLNNDKKCNPPADDHVWHRDIPVVANNVDLVVTHDSVWVDVCASFAK